MEAKWGSVLIPTGKSQEEYADLAIRYQNLSEELGDLVAQALYYEEKMKYEKDTAYSLAFLGATNGTDKISDRQRDAMAKNAAEVKVYDFKLIDARAYREFLRNKHDSAIRAHHICKEKMKMTEARSWIG